MKKKVLVFMTADILHFGHVFFLEYANKFGNVSVMLPTDERVEFLKKKPPYNDFKTRKDNLLKLDIVKNVYCEDSSNEWNSLKKINPDIIVLGKDQIFWADKLYYILNLYNLNTTILMCNEELNREEYSSSAIRICLENTNRKV